LYSEEIFVDSGTLGEIQGNLAPFVEKVVFDYKSKAEQKDNFDNLKEVVVLRKDNVVVLRNDKVVDIHFEMKDKKDNQ
jgi:hypothetical protein